MLDRFLGCVGVVALVAVAVVVITGQAGKRTVTAQEFVLVDAAGNPQAALALMAGDEPGIGLLR